MNKFTQLLIVGLFMLCSQQIVGQQNYDMLFQTTTIRDGDKYLDRVPSAQILRSYRFDGQYYLILQFKDIPTPELREQLSDKGIKLLGYLPNFAYWASVPSSINLNDLSVRAIILPKPTYKLSLQLYKKVSLPNHITDLLKVQVYPFPGISPEQLGVELLKSRSSIKKIDDKRIQLEISTDQVLSLAASPAVMYLETVSPPPVREDTEARSLHGIHLLSQPSGLNLDGSGIVISIGDKDTIVHPDFKNRVTHHFERDDPEQHADMVSGILAGAGNIDPTAMGMAPRATFHLFDIFTYEHIEQAPENFDRYGATITSTSYAEGCGGRYESTAIDIDDQVYQNPYLLHCFSVGNEADDPCSDTYGEVIDDQGFYFGNVTGGRKAAKNVIAVGNLHYDDRLMTLSSRGPANDGRIKPDLCAFGQGQRSTYPEDTYRSSGGSSAAAPVVAGAAAVLTQLYRKLEPMSTMPSDLLKPVLLNTTEDLGQPGPDFKYGWGRLQVKRAAEILMEGHYLKGEVVHTQEKGHQINIPANVSDLRIMLYWHDPAASPAAGKALVNDLDLVVQSPDGTNLRPFVLSTAAHIDSISKPAYPGIDRINNVEQVQIGFPVPGNYDIRVKGHLIPEGPQSYYLVYSYRQKALDLMYPVGGERFSPGENQIIRWDAFGVDTPFDLAYRLQGQTWNQITTNIPSGLRHFNWTVPEEIIGLAEIRIQSGSYESISPASFNILGIPDFDFLYESEQTAWIEWTPVDGADSYEVYRLGDRYMERIERTSDNRLLIHTHPDTLKWYSVCAKRSDGTLGRRALAKRYLNMPCESMVNLKIQFDASPGEIQWQIQNEVGIVVASSDDYSQQSPFSLLEISACLANGCYEFIIRDSYGDGLCCKNGQGYYLLTDEEDTVLASGDTFVREDRMSFCLNAATIPPPVVPLSVAIVEHQDLACAGQENGRVIVQASGGHGNYNYAWSNGHRDSSLVNVGAGLYEVTVTDGIFIVTKEVQINEPVPLSITFDILSGACQQDATGQISATVTGGISPYEYAWSNGSQDASITDLSPGSYMLSVTDANGCEAVESVMVNASSAMTLILFRQQPSCSESADGRVMTAIFGGLPPYQFLWSNGAVGASPNQLAEGNYTLSVTDANGCVATSELQLTARSYIDVNAIVEPVTNDSPGSIQLQISGNGPNFQTEWSDGNTSIIRNGLSAGAYSVTVTNFRGCSQSRTFIVPDESTSMTPEYCLSAGAYSNREWIALVGINNVYFSSGSDEGYNSHVDQPVDVNTGESFTLKLEKGSRTSSSLHYWSVWIDFNQNGQLDDEGELVFQNEERQDIHEAQIEIPDSLTGQTRMRVSMQWGAHPGPCDQINWGEVEDYTLNFVQSASQRQGRMVLSPLFEAENNPTPVLKVWPNPAKDHISLDYQRLPKEPGVLYLTNSLGQEVKKWNWIYDGTHGRRQVDLPSHLNPGVYYLHLRIGQWQELERLVIAR